jgi:hypothetical protein
MRAYALTHLNDAVLLRDLTTLVARDRASTAALLAHLAEVDVRRLYVPAGYPSMFEYCVGELRLSEDAALKRIRAARAARQFPGLFPALADGRLHLTAVIWIAPHLTPENAGELIAAVAHRRKSEIEQLLAHRFPRPLASEPVESPTIRQLVPEPVAAAVPDLVAALAPERVETPAPRLQAAPPPERFPLPSIGKDTHDKLRHAQALLSHAVPSGDIAQVLDRALDALITQLEKSKFGATRRPRPESGVRPNPATNPRYVPAQVKRAVWERDQGQCTFVGETGHRCCSRRFLEFDHVDPVARGGRASVERIRLRCRAHNQYEAERAFGAGFMKAKRDEARRANDARRAAAEQQAQDVIAGLRGLGFRAEEARRAVESSGTLDDATLQERMRAALRFLGQRRERTGASNASTRGVDAADGRSGPMHAPHGTAGQRNGPGIVTAPYLGPGSRSRGSSGGRGTHSTWTESPGPRTCVESDSSSESPRPTSIEQKASRQ